MKIEEKLKKINKIKKKIKFLDINLRFLIKLQILLKNVIKKITFPLMLSPDYSFRRKIMKKLNKLLKCSILTKKRYFLLKSPCELKCFKENKKSMIFYIMMQKFVMRENPKIKNRAKCLNLNNLFIRLIKIRLLLKVQCQDL